MEERLAGLLVPSLWSTKTWQSVRRRRLLFGFDNDNDNTKQPHIVIRPSINRFSFIVFINVIVVCVCVCDLECVITSWNVSPAIHKQFSH